MRNYFMPMRCVSASPFLLITVSLFLSSCVPVPPEMMPSSPGSAASSTAFPDIDPGGTSVTSLHFALRGYSEVDMRAVSASAEDIFNKIGTDTGLYSYLAGQTFTIVLYKDQAEYATKTRQTSPLRVVIGAGTIYTYPGPDLEPMLAHQLMHLIFATYMADKASSLNWLNEGLAMYEEVNRMSQSDKVVFQTTQANKLRTERQPFSQMVFFAGSAEDRRRQDVWYLQVESVIDFMLKQGTSLTFAALLNQLRNGTDIDHAIAENYNGKYRGWADLETSWQAQL